MEPLNGAFGVIEQFRIFVDVILREFCNKQDMEEYIFPFELTIDQQEFIHEKCSSLRLISKSQGKEPNCKIYIRKSNKLFYLQQNEKAVLEINNSVVKYQECININGIKKPKKISNYCPQNDQIFNRLSSGCKVAVDAPLPNKLLKLREKLPVSSMKEEFLELLDLNQVIIVTSETGSGKSTQIPQFILESICAERKTCKIICTQPRRLSTVSVAQRVSAERGEELGSTVGYQINLKYLCSPRSALVYCTNGVLLRTLMNFNENYLKNITHVIVDEIHERDKYTDFVLISLKQCLSHYPDLKLILMSATADVDLFMSYFQDAQLLNIPGKLHQVHELFLEDILLEFNYGNAESGEILLQEGDLAMGTSNIGTYQVSSIDEVLYNEQCKTQMMNSAIHKCMSLGEESCFEQLLHLIWSENGNVNHQTPIEGFTPLMAAAAHGNINVVEQLLYLGANTTLVSSNPSLSAAKWAHFYGKYDVCKLIQLYDSLNGEGNKQIQYEENVEKLLKNYYQTISDEATDYALIVKLIAHIHRRDKCGTILVFLSGYEDVINCQESIITSPSFNYKEFEIFVLHGSMNITAQHCVFDVIVNKQKIVLSTNIAETSITIPDVVYVIDSGRAKEKLYDSTSDTCALKNIWISKASVKQRAGRAGRTQTGICFHTFSKQQYRAMPNNRVPEILRVPLHELCLQTKLLAPKHMNIAEYLKGALEPPPPLSVANAIQSLKTLGALNDNEDLTPLGQHLVQLSVEPRLGKMLIYAVIFKCLDPILTMVACLAYKEPFILPQQPRMKQLAIQKRKELAGNSLSDHLTLLRAFQFWQEVKVCHQENDLVQNHFISWTAMEIIHATRSQLLSQLRGAGFVSLQRSCTIQDLNVNSSHWAIVKAALAAGCYPNIAFTENSHFATRTEEKVDFHQSSTLHNFNCDKNDLAGNDYCVIYEELAKVGNHCSIKCGTVVTPFTVALICGDQNEVFNNYLKIDDGLNFQHDHSNIIAAFRETVKTVINSKIINPQHILNAVEQDVLNSVLKILNTEEQQYQLPQPAGVGLIPKLFLNVKSRNCEQQLFDLNSQYSRPRDARRNYYNPSNRPENNSVNGLSDPFSNRLNISKASRAHDRHNAHSFNAVGQSTKNYTNTEQRNDYGKHIYAQMCASDTAVNDNGFSGCVPVSQSGQTNFHKSNGESAGNNLMRAISTAKLPEYKLKYNSDILPLESLDLPEKTKFFIIKPPDYNSLQMGISRGSWIFSPQSERKIFKILNQGNFVVLFFTISKSQEFQGLANLLTTNGGDVNSSCPIQWLSTTVIPYRRIRIKNLQNPYNQYRFIFQCNDGQEVEYNAGRQLCNLFFEPVPQDEFTSSRPILGSFKNN